MAPWNPVYKGIKAYQIIVEISTGIHKPLHTVHLFWNDEHPVTRKGLWMADCRRCRTAHCQPTSAHISTHARLHAACAPVSQWKWSQDAQPLVPHSPCQPHRTKKKNSTSRAKLLQHLQWLSNQTWCNSWTSWKQSRNFTQRIWYCLVLYSIHIVMLSIWRLTSFIPHPCSCRKLLHSGLDPRAQSRLTTRHVLRTQHPVTP